MQITPVNSTRRIFSVTDVLSATSIEQIRKVDWINIPWRRPDMQETWPRRQLDSTKCPILNSITSEIFDLKPQIEEQCGVEFAYLSTIWWLDEPGFTVSIHTDGHLPSSMQLFWVMPTEQHGTVFLNSKNIDDVQFAPRAIENTGYIMLNSLNEDGSQPLHWHGMLNPVPEGTIRVCSYTTFGTYKHK